MKRKIDPGTYIYPLPVVLIGVNDAAAKPTFMVCAYVSGIDHAPPRIIVSMGKDHYTNEHLEREGAFSVNIASRKLASALDYCGTRSGSDVDKSTVFKTFYGDLGTVPMIESCPINLECTLHSRQEFEATVAYIGDIVNVYTEDEYLENGLPDITKVDPIVFSMHDFKYFGVGDHIGNAFSLAPGHDDTQPA